VTEPVLPTERLNRALLARKLGRPSGPLPAHVGRNPSRSCSPHANSAGALPTSRVQHKDAALGPTFLVAGAVAGTWRYKGDRVELKPLEPLPRGVRRELEDEAAQLSAFHAD
jgi:Winged helix DNA-binding domain